MLQVEDKVALAFTEICERMDAIELPEVDAVVGIATGGIVPASLLAYRLRKPLFTLQINYRAEDNSPRYDAPRILSAPEIPAEFKRILLVDDVSVSGKTMQCAEELLKDREVLQFALKGKADYVVFPEVASCVLWPWRTYGETE